jgi:hypothetical protein
MSGLTVSGLTVFVPSPLVGPASWAAVAEAWRGRSVILDTTGDDAADVLAAMLDGIPAGEPVTLVAHSNAGAYVPSIAAARNVESQVFVDAILPPSSGGVSLTSPELLDFLESLAGPEGTLPIWSDWWGDAVDSYLPDAETRAAIEQSQPRLPLAYFHDSLPTPEGWDARPSAYLAFGDTYAPELAGAELRGWPTATLDGHHLHLLVDPEGVAAAIASLDQRARTLRR